MRLDETVSKHYEALNPNDKLIWQYISAHRGECCNISIDDLALRCNVSRSTVMRFAQKLEMKGFSELKAFIRWEFGDFQDTEEDLVDDVCHSVIQTVERFRNMDCEGIFRLLNNANRIFVYGTGSVQRTVAEEFKREFLNVNVLVYNIMGESEFDKVLGSMTAGDVVLIISKSGESEFIKRILVSLKSRQVSVVSLTNSGNNTLANRSDYNLFLSYGGRKVTDTLYFEAAAQLFLVVQLIFTKYIMYMKKEADKD